MLKDYKMAEDYCSEHKHESEDLTLSLFKVYLNQPKAPTDIVPKAALELLAHHATELNPEFVLELLPSNLPLNQISKYLCIVCLPSFFQSQF